MANLQNVNISVETSPTQISPPFIYDMMSPSISNSASNASVDEMFSGSSDTGSSCLLHIFNGLTLFEDLAPKESGQRNDNLSHARAQRPRPPRRWRRAKKAKKLNQFARFRCFPAEIRLKIWKFCFPPPLRITLENSWEKKRLYKRQRENYTSVTHLHLRHCYLCGAFSNYIGPVTLRICQESRIETLKIYSLLFANNPLISPVYFSRKRDVFSIKGDYCKSDTARTIRALRYTSPLTELRHIQCISMPRSDFETQWMAEELFRTCIWVEELLLRDGEWHLYPSNQVSNQDHIRQLGERWFFYKQLPSLTKVHLKTLRILSGSGRTKYGETDLTAIEVPPAAVLKRRYRDIIEWSDRLGLRPLPRSVPVWTEYE